MEWMTGLALLPVLLCGVMMGGMALAAALGLRRNQQQPSGGDVAKDAPTDRGRLSA